MKNLLLTVTLISATFLTGNRQKPTISTSAGVERGRYLVENIAMCGQCHTSRDGSGELIRSQWLQGAAVPITNPYYNRLWAEFAPRIAGLPQYSDEQGMKLLTEGTSRAGKPLRGPMPPYRLSEQDAKDIIVYLRSLE